MSGGNEHCCSLASAGAWNGGERERESLAESNVLPIPSCHLHLPVASCAMAHCPWPTATATTPCLTADGSLVA